MRRVIRVPWEGHMLVGNVLASEEPPRLLVLHGGGQSNRWESSDAWELLSRFAGRLLIVAGERDPVIPAEVIQRIYVENSIAGERLLAL